MVHKKEKIYIQCGEEDGCKRKNCIKCPRKLSLTRKTLTLAEAMCIEDFGVVDLTQQINERPKLIDMQQDIMRKMMNRIIWEKKGRWIRKLKWMLKI